MISDESDSNDTNSDTYEELLVSAQYAEVNRDAENATENLYYDESVSPINEEEYLTNIQDLGKVIDIFPEEANNKHLRSSENRPKIKTHGAGID